VQGRHGTELALAKEAVQLWREAANEGDFELVNGGNLYIQTTEQERPVLEALVREAHRVGFTEVSLLDVDEAREVIPAATGPFLGAMWSPIDAHCQPEKGTELYVKRAQQAGAQFHFGVKALRLRENVGRIAGVETSKGPISAGAVVLAAGAWTSYLTKTVGLRTPIMPVVMSELETKSVKPLFAQTLRAFGFGARQRPDGRVVVSAGLNAKVGHAASLADLNGLTYWLPRAWAFRKSIRLSVDFRRTGQQIRDRTILSADHVPQTSPEPRTDKPLVHAALSKLASVVPELGDARVGRHWAGLVDMTPDGLPIIDGDTGPAGLVVIAGLCGHGFTLGPVLGEIASDLVLDGLTRRAIDEFSHRRFEDRDRVGRPEMMI
jgi:glycine/D-amino acid oxidase-like deaminating enzyme